MGLGIFVWLPSSRKRLAILATLRTSAICLGWWLDKLPHCCPTQLLQETLLSVEVLPPARSGWLSPQAVDWVTCSSKAISSAFFPHNYPRTTPLPELSPEHDQSSFSSAFTQKFNNGTPPPRPRQEQTTQQRKHVRRAPPQWPSLGLPLSLLLVLTLDAEGHTL